MTGGLTMNRNLWTVPNQQTSVGLQAPKGNTDQNTSKVYHSAFWFLLLWISERVNGGQNQFIITSNLSVKNKQPDSSHEIFLFLLYLLEWHYHGSIWGFFVSYKVLSE